MKPSKALIIVSLLAGVLAVIQAGAGLFVQTPGAPWDFTTLHGDQVQINGQGLYAFDTYFRAPVFRGTDAVTLFLGVPLLVISLYFYTRGSLRGKLLLTGALAYLLYNACSVAFGVAYNNLFLVYVAYFSACLFGLAVALYTYDLKALGGRVSNTIPRKRIAGLMFLSAVGLTMAWVPDVLSALLQNRVPAIASYTTEVTYVFDLGIIIPLSVLAGIFTLRRKPAGYLMAAILLTVLVVVGVLVTVQTVFQSMAGITLTVPEFVAKAGSFMVLSLFAVWLLVLFLRGVSESEKPLTAAGRAVKTKRGQAV